LAQILIVADDLSGAADCGVACAVQGLDTMVVLDEAAGDADVLAFDADTRATAPDEAATKTARLVRAYARGDRQILFKKFDSTLRGHIGVEIAAALETWRSVPDRNSAIVVVAPAFPATGRTTIGGRQWLDAVRLEPDLQAMLGGAGLRTGCVGLETLRFGRLPGLLQTNAARYTALVCDAETDADLHLIAQAAASLREGAVWAGCAGLARFLPAALDLPRNGPRAMVAPSRKGPVLVVVGSLAGLSRTQAGVLSATKEVAVVTLSPQGLLGGPGTREWRDGHDRIIDALSAGRDVLTLLGAEDRLSDDMSPRLVNALACLLGPCWSAIGGLVLTGGETARAILGAAGVRFLVPVREVESGVPLALASTANGERLPVITKAGAFGDFNTLVCCRDALRNLLR
jgi:4-hydroxythreonine-4-phosphate dehydrogenase